MTTTPEIALFYFERHFLATEDLASQSGYESQDIEFLATRRLIPGPSFQIHHDQKAISSKCCAVYFAPWTANLKPGHYFDKATLSWLKRLDDNPIVNHKADYIAAHKTLWVAQDEETYLSNWLQAYQLWQDGIWGILIKEPSDFETIIKFQQATFTLTKLQQKRHQQPTDSSNHQAILKAQENLRQQSKPRPPWDQLKA